MASWLVKEEPTHYSFGDLVREGAVTWTGVHNALAQRHLRAMRPGDLVYYYHTGAERAIVGVCEVASVPAIDPEDPRGAFAVLLKPVRSLRRPVALAEIRADPRFERFPLVRISRLSVMPVSVREWKRVEAISRTSTPDTEPLR